ncbi:hypothetical protein FED16_19195 [Acinetobacter baumannii]|nr:hypothetical protein FED16_19195 [Acinetobacter baumannii]
MAISNLSTYLLLLLFLAIVASVSSESCVYTILVKTGTEGGSTASTDAKISLILKDAYGTKVNMTNLETYGTMGSGHNYFQMGNLDSFGITTTCMKSSVCSITLSSDNSGKFPSWFVDYVQVLTLAGSSRAPGDNIIFEIYGWVSKDHAPNNLTRTFDSCCPPTQLQQITDVII